MSAFRLLVEWSVDHSLSKYLYEVIGFCSYHRVFEDLIARYRTHKQTRIM